MDVLIVNGTDKQVWPTAVVPPPGSPPAAAAPPPEAAAPAPAPVLTEAEPAKLPMNLLLKCSDTDFIHSASGKKKLRWSGGTLDDLRRVIAEKCSCRKSDFGIHFEDADLGPGQVVEFEYIEDLHDKLQLIIVPNPKRR